jgi:superfamily II DNA/RNA helicase
VIQRFSSRRERLDHSFLNARLNGAVAYDRIAGYFTSGILEVAGEALELVEGVVRVVCNSDLDPRDVEVARAAAHAAMRREWCASQPERLGDAARPRFAKLYDLLRSGKLQVRVLPDEKFGLIHGKAGVITLADGSRTAFLGSVNETRRAWLVNYELLWEDPAPEAAEWVQEEFDALWSSPYAVPLAEFVIEDVGRIARREVLPGVDKWRTEPEPAAPVVESPVYRREYGLWAHQKYFVQRAFEAHRLAGARFVLADQVGLGKTVQLALSAMLMALYGSRPVLVLAPKALLLQWQDELRELLDLPSAVWTGKSWVDENGIDHPTAGPEGIRRCPRRVGIVSQGLVTSGSDAAGHLLSLQYECVVVDEAHRARRRNLGPGRENETPDPNNLLAFLHRISGRTRSMLLATATPVQLYPVEAWDLLAALSHGNEHVLGNDWSNWRTPSEALGLVMGERHLPDDDGVQWQWMRNPLPPASEHRDFALIRRSLDLEDRAAVAPGDAWDRLSPPDRARLRQRAEVFGHHHNPFIRQIIRRTRSYLEEAIDPETKEPYLKPVRVKLFGEADNEAILLPTYLRDAYTVAEEFCRMLASRAQGAGFMKTLLLRRVGSTIYAGHRTASDLLGTWGNLPELDDEEELSSEEARQLRMLTPQERGKLQEFVDALEANQERDPKYQAVTEYLLQRQWVEQGCIIFSQYYDSVRWLAEELSTNELPNEDIGIYAGASRSGVMRAGQFTAVARDELKKRVRSGDLRLLLGTDAASEGLNLQRLGTLINLDLPWNPTRLEQRKGRIQRIGQQRETVLVYNMRYRDSVEDRVHDLLSQRLESIFGLFGQVPDVLEDVWVDVALGRVEDAKRTIGAVPEKHPFELRYHTVENIDWESCATVLDADERRRYLAEPW